MLTQRTLAVAAVLVALLVARRWTPAALLDRVSAALRWRWAPLIAGAVTALIMVWVWGSLHGSPIAHDEIAYLTQARIYSSFHLYAPARPLPEFFEQYHMFVTPHFMAKYPPGQPLLLVPGIWLGMPGLVPLLLAGIAGALIFALARRITNEWVALLAWMLWTTAPGVMQFLPSYFSETTSCALGLLGWYALLRWREQGLRRWLLLVAACIGFGMLTHPFIWLLYAIPAGVVVIVTVVRRGLWRDLACATAVGCGFLVVLLAWNTATMGQPLRFPWSVYARTYFPVDAIGFGVDSTPPLRPLPQDMVNFASTIRWLHEQHTISMAPTRLVRQLQMLGASIWGDWLYPLAILALLGLAGISAELAFALASSAVVVAGFMLYAHPAFWTIYYVQTLPVLAFLLALGIWRFFSFLGGPKPQLRDLRAIMPSRPAAMAVLIIAILYWPLAASSMRKSRQSHSLLSLQMDVFTSYLAQLPGDHVMVFVRYSPRHNPNLTLIFNDPDLDHARAWRVFDRGADDIRLIRLAPDRIPYLYDETTNSFARMDTSVAIAHAATDTGTSVAQTR
jgi:hypothetical protein